MVEHSRYPRQGSIKSQNDLESSRRLQKILSLVLEGYIRFLKVIEGS